LNEHADVYNPYSDGGAFKNIKVKLLIDWLKLLIDWLKLLIDWLIVI